MVNERNPPIRINLILISLFGLSPEQAAEVKESLATASQSADGTVPFDAFDGVSEETLNTILRNGKAEFQTLEPIR